MKKDKDILVFYYNLNNIGYTGDGDRSSNSKAFNTEELPRRVSKIEAVIEDESDDLQGEGLEVIIPTELIGSWTRLEVILALKLCGHLDRIIKFNR